MLKSHIKLINLNYLLQHGMINLNYEMGHILIRYSDYIQNQIILSIL